MNFLLQNFVGGNGLGSRPGIQIVQAEKNRDEENRHERQRHESGFEKPARGISPTSAGEIMNHRRVETAERESDPKNKRDQIGDEKFAADSNADANAAKNQKQQRRWQKKFFAGD